jgi:spore germination cell wall hydrolase CwlJ-like protein
MYLRIYLFLSLLLITIISFANITPNVDGKFIEVNYNQLTSDAQKQVSCLAENIYFESAHEPKDGRIAVALVTLNRVNDLRYPSDICGVVLQRNRNTSGRVVCQFSWYCEANKSIRNTRAFQEAKDIALFVYANYDKIEDFTGGALFYHADYVSVNKIGVSNLEKTVVVGRHIFYKERTEI